MEDQRAMEGIIHQIKDIERNNWDNMEHITSIDLLLTSDNNGTVKDAEISHRFDRLRSKLEELIDVTDNFIMFLNEEADKDSIR